MQTKLFTTANYRVDMPWASLDREALLIKMIWKAAIAIAFIADK